MNLLCLIIATALFLIAGVMEVADEAEFVGLTVRAFALFGLFFFALGSWIGGGIAWIVTRNA